MSETPDVLRQRLHEAVEVQENTETLAELLRDNADLFRPYPEAQVRIYVEDGAVNIDSGQGDVFSGAFRVTIATNEIAARDGGDCYYLRPDEQDDVR